MSHLFTETTHDIVEVPPELRGLSDDEIIRNSESKDRDISGKRKNGSHRPSKRERLAQKQEKSQKEVEKIAAEIFGGVTAAPDMSKLPREKRKLLKTAFTPKSAGYSKVSKDAFAIPAAPVEKPEPRSMISEAPKPASGRVLKASFGNKLGEKPKAVIVSATDLAQQKAAERAKKIQDFFKAKHPEATTMPDGQPIKRGRGRPRKKPLF